MKAGDKYWHYAKYTNDLVQVDIIQGPNWNNVCVCRYKNTDMRMVFGTLFERKEDCLKAAKLQLEREAKKWKTQYRNQVKYLDNFKKKFGGGAE